MNIILRELSEVIVKNINYQAKENGMSRNEFLKNYLETLAYKNKSDELKSDYQELINELLETLKWYGKMLNKFVDEFIIDPEDVYFLDKEIECIEEKKEKENIFLDGLTEKKSMTIREIPEEVFIRIGELADERGISKNEFLNRYLRQLTYSGSEKMVDTEYQYLVKKTLGVLEYTNRIFDVFQNENIINVKE